MNKEFLKHDLIEELRKEIALRKDMEKDLKEANRLLEQREEMLRRQELKVDSLKREFFGSLFGERF